MLGGEVVTNVIGFFLIYMIIFAVGSVIMALMGLDLITAVASVAATLGNIGPGLGRVGATQNYAWISVHGKWILTFLILAGRLELYSILILFLPSTWKK